MQIFSRLAAICGIAGLGVIVAEVFNNAHWLALRVQIAHVVLPLLALYLLYELAIRMVRQQTVHRGPVGKAARVLLGAARSIYCTLGIIALLSIPLLWWGGIKRLAEHAGV
ncbi:MAG: hypothetical protein AMJ54_12130 [Deltaproteobacteria bacterium SG8_13]|nr:MAG: hypothetical protein AMJ54_12130 [Deltaproteobacteria bacterium SG8_13]